jgi:hypothetical protein
VAQQLTREEFLKSFKADAHFKQYAKGIGPSAKANDLILRVATVNREIRNNLAQQIADAYGVTQKERVVKFWGFTVKIKPPELAINLKPKDITPSIVDRWMTCKDMINCTKIYIGNQDVTRIQRDIILKMLDDTIAGTNTTIPFNSEDKKLIPSEFFEILTAAKLARLIELGDKKTFETLKMPPGIKRGTNVKIFIPDKGNYPLLDFQIKIDELKNSLKISVKSYVSGTRANTVKFDSIFKNGADVDRWKNEQKTNQEVQAKVAKTAVTTTESKGLFAIKALYEILDSNMLGSLRQIVDKFVEPKQYSTFLEVLKKTSHELSNLSKATEFSDKTLRLSVTEIRDIIIILTKVHPRAMPIVGNLMHLCEKILVQMTREDSITKINFYQLFYDNVLLKNDIAYAISTFKDTQITYSFYTAVNITNYFGHREPWIELYSKNSMATKGSGGINSLGKGTLGMSL